MSTRQGKNCCNRTANCSPACPTFPIASQAEECSRTHLDFRSNCYTAFYSSNPICCLLISGPMFIPSAMGADGFRYNQIYAREKDRPAQSLNGFGIYSWSGRLKQQRTSKISYAAFCVCIDDKHSYRTWRQEDKCLCIALPRSHKSYLQQASLRRV